jgi:hypothetical protein
MCDKTFFVGFPKKKKENAEKILQNTTEKQSQQLSKKETPKR